MAQEGLDRGRPVQVDPATITLVSTMIEAWRATDDRFDPTILPALMRRAGIDLWIVLKTIKVVLSGDGAR